MFSLPSHPDVVLPLLGDKFLAALVSSVSGVRTDIQDLRAFRPGWFPGMAQRTLANVIHDRLWDRMTIALDGADEYAIVDQEPFRQIAVGTNIMVRFKRHKESDLISTYETQGALDFWSQGGDEFPGFELMTLAAGYRWDSELREIGAAVVSYREGKHNPIWCVELDGGAEGVEAISWKPVEAPDLPSIRLEFGDEKSEGEGLL